MRACRRVLLAVGSLAAVSCAGSEPTPSAPVEAVDTTTISPSTSAVTSTAPATDTASSTMPSSTSEMTTAASATTSEVTTVPESSEPAVSATVLAAIETELLVSDGTTATLASRLDELAIPGAAIVVVADGEPLVSLAAGTTPDGRPMTTDTVLQVGSVSKPVAAAVIASLVDEGTIDWSDDAAAMLDLDLGSDDPTTFDALLSHTAGVNVDGFLGYASTAETPSVSEVIAGDGATEPIAVAFEPGAGFVYSGGGYVVAAESAAVATSGSFDDLARVRLFEPIGMVDSAFSIDPPAGVSERLSIGSLGVQPLEQGWQRHPEHAAAGLWTTADDLGRFLVAFGASLRGGDVLGAEIAAAMVEPVASVEGDGSPYAAIGRGWFLDDVVDPVVYRHNGRNIGYTAEIAGTVDGDSGVVVVTNSFPGGTELAREVIATVAAGLEWRS